MPWGSTPHAEDACYNIALEQTYLTQRRVPAGALSTLSAAAQLTQGEEQDAMARTDRRARHGHGGERHARTGPPPLTNAQRTALEALLGELPALAGALREAQDGGREALAAELGRIEQMEEPVALAFALRLGDIRGPLARDATDVAQAIGELDPRREVAREARRARLRLQSAGATPSLTIAPLPVAIARAALATAEAVHVPTIHYPRLAEGYATRSRDAGELSLVLAWQETSDSDYVRAYLILLDFWRHGLKDFASTAPMARRRFRQEVLPRMKARQANQVPITWAQARRLVLDALAVNELMGTAPHSDFTPFRAEVEERLIGEPQDDEERRAIAAEAERSAREGDRPFIASGLEPEETIANWIGAWSFGDYGLAYDLLGDENPLRRAQTRDEFIALRRTWAKEAQPASLRMTIIREQECRASALWVPGVPAAGLAGASRDYEAFWSLVLKDTPVGGQVEELPMATLISGETARHWYWTAYTLQRERTHGLWTIARIRDEGRASQGLTVEELQQRLKDTHARLDEMVRTTPEAPRNEEEAAELAEQASTLMTSSLHYHDALIARLPLDEATYRAAVDDARAFASHERAEALLQRMLARFAATPRLRFELGLEQFVVAETYTQQGQPEGATAWLERAAATLTQVVEAEPTRQHLQALAEVLMRRGHLTSAEARLREALALEETYAPLHADLASALMGQVSGENLEDPGQPSRERQQELAHEALAELRRTSELDSALPRLHTRIGAIYQILEQPDDARIAFEEAIRRDPGDADAQYALGSLLLNRQQVPEALPLLETAVQLEPLTVPYRLALAGAYALLERRQEAERELTLIDRISPGLPQVAELRTIMARTARR
jgi:tetratricopeptide (TPR) repeat protein